METSIIRLSIIIPIYNAKKYLPDCMDSILNELEPDTEVLLLDDGSKDDSYHMCLEYSQSNIRALHHENNGVSYTRNRGIDEAVGDYVMFVDADDRMIPGWSHLVRGAIENNNDVIYFSEKLKGKCPDRNVIIENIFGIRDSENLGYMAAPWSKLFRRDFLKKYTIRFDETLINGEDTLFNLHVILNTTQFLCIGDSIYLYRINNESASRKFNDRFFKSNLKYFEIAEKKMESSGLVSTSDIDKYISYSFTYSIYLYIFLVSTITETEKKKNALHMIRNDSMQFYFNRYDASKHCGILVRFFYYIEKNRMEKSALVLMRLVNAIRKTKKNGIVWENV